MGNEKRAKKKCNFFSGWTVRTWLSKTSAQVKTPQRWDFCNTFSPQVYNAAFLRTSSEFITGFCQTSQCSCRATELRGGEDRASADTSYCYSSSHSTGVSEAYRISDALFSLIFQCNVISFGLGVYILKIKDAALTDFCQLFIQRRVGAADADRWTLSRGQSHPYSSQCYGEGGDVKPPFHHQYQLKKTMQHNAMHKLLVSSLLPSPALSMVLKPHAAILYIHPLFTHWSWRNSLWTF